VALSGEGRQEAGPAAAGRLSSFGQASQAGRLATPIPTLEPPACPGTGAWRQMRSWSDRAPTTCRKATRGATNRVAMPQTAWQCHKPRGNATNRVAMPESSDLEQPLVFTGHRRPYRPTRFLPSFCRAKMEA